MCLLLLFFLYMLPVGASSSVPSCARFHREWWGYPLHEIKQFELFRYIDFVGNYWKHGQLSYKGQYCLGQEMIIFLQCMNEYNQKRQRELYSAHSLFLDSKVMYEASSYKRLQQGNPPFKQVPGAVDQALLVVQQIAKKIDTFYARVPQAGIFRLASTKSPCYTVEAVDPTEFVLMQLEVEHHSR